MKKIEEIKEFKDIETYYEISNMIEEILQDRVESQKHLVIANKEIERLNNIINELEKLLVEELPYLYEIDKEYENIEGDTYFTYKEYDYEKVLDKLKELKENNEC